VVAMPSSVSCCHRTRRERWKQLVTTSALLREFKLHLARFHRPLWVGTVAHCVLLEYFKTSVCIKPKQLVVCKIADRARLFRFSGEWLVVK